MGEEGAGERRLWVPRSESRDVSSPFGAWGK